MNGALRAVLSRYPSWARPTSDPEPLGNAGGFSGARIWRVATARGILAARAWPVDGPDRAALSRLHALLAGAGGLGFLPVPIPAMDGRTVVAAEGLLWEVAPWMPGSADLSRPPAPARLRSMFAGLGAFHARVGSDRLEGPSPGLAARSADLERLLFGEFDAIAGASARSPADPRSALARAWLDRARPMAPGLLDRIRRAAACPVVLQPCLRDARPDHFLFEGDRLTGLVDFGAMGRDAVSGDLARLLAEAVGPDRAARAEALAAYDSARPLAGSEAALIDDFERANALLGAGRWARWHFLERRTFDDPEAVARGLRRGLDRIEEVGRSMGNG